MAAARGERPGEFLYEPSHPPTIPPRQTIDAYRRGRLRRRRGWRRREEALTAERREPMPECTPAEEQSDHLASDLAA